MEHSEQALFEELLIEEVHKYEHLWKIKSNNFKDVERASNSWKEIAATLRSLSIATTDEACKKKWKYLRDAYSRLKREKVFRKVVMEHSTHRRMSNGSFINP